MPFLPPMTGNGNHTIYKHGIIVIFLGDGAKMALFYPHYNCLLRAKQKKRLRPMNLQSAVNDPRNGSESSPINQQNGPSWSDCCSKNSQTDWYLQCVMTKVGSK